MPDKFDTELPQLHFDPENPRFVNDFGNDPTPMFRYLITDIGVEDLLQSISASGLIDGDPIIVRDRPEGGYYVIEGNRRLAALKLLLGERPNDDLPLPAIPEISDEVRRTFERIPVQSGWSPDLLQAYLGYKHVTAAREWPPEAKAKFVFDHASGDFSKPRLTTFAKTLGTTYATLRRWLVAFLTLKQAEDNDLFDASKAPTKRYFGTFYTLLGGQEAQKFLALQADPIQTNPVPADNLPELGEFVRWTIGTLETRAAVNSRQQDAFERVLGSPKALKHFRATSDLEGSLFYTEYNIEEVAEKLSLAAYIIEGCLTKLYDVRENATVQEAFSDLEGAYKKAVHNMGPPQAE